MEKNNKEIAAVIAAGSTRRCGRRVGGACCPRAQIPAAEARERFHFWHTGQKNVERPFCTMRLMVPRAAARRARLALAVIDAEVVLEIAELAVGAAVVAQRRAAGLDGVLEHRLDRVDQLLARARSARRLRSAMVEALRFGDSSARLSASQT